MDSLIVASQNSLHYVKKHPQLLLTLALIVIIPIAFLLSGQQFLNAARENQESLEQERVGILHDLFISIVRSNGYNSEATQSEIELIQAENPDIVEFQFVKKVDSSLQVLASLHPDSINTSVQNPKAFRASNIDPDRSLIMSSAENGVRYWNAFRLVRGTDGNEYYIYTKTSLAHIDSLFASRIITAYYWLLGILSVVMILIVRHVRLVDYAYLYRETKRANEMKDLFTNMIAHELRAPLTAMRGYASLIRERKSIDIETKEQATKIENSSERLILIVSDLLDVARIHSGKLAITNTRINVQAVIASVLDAMKVAGDEKQIILSQEGVKTDLFIQIDEKRLFQALTNLVSNSIKYTHAGTISVELIDKSDRVEIRVKDTGMGISAENQKNLFAPFFRVENSQVSNTVGTGLGMWITKQLIELMKGSIGVESIKGVGTHIVVTLPK